MKLPFCDLPTLQSALDSSFATLASSILPTPVFKLGNPPRLFVFFLTYKPEV
jgi:hypothetical protein